MWPDFFLSVGNLKGSCVFPPTVISVAALSRKTILRVPRTEERVAVCVYGGELSLSRLWGSVKVLLEFDETDVNSYEAER